MHLFTLFLSIFVVTPRISGGGGGGFKGIPPPQRNSQRTGNALYQVANSPQTNPQTHQIQVSIEATRMYAEVKEKFTLSVGVKLNRSDLK